HGQVDRSDLNLNDLAEKILEREGKYVQIAQGLRVLDSAALAIQLGLAGKALDLLLESDVAAFGQQGMILELELLLKTGRVKEVREWTGRQQAGKEAKAMLGEISFFWFRAQALAAAGDYELAERELEQLATAWRGTQTLGKNKQPMGPREKMALVIAKSILDEQPLIGSCASYLWQVPRRFEFRDHLVAFARNLRQEANANVLRGLLALEEGQVDKARAAFDAAIGLWRNETSAAAGAGLDF